MNTRDTMCLILMPLSAGTRLGPYEILAPIGAGGMGEVYKARDTRLDRTVAIKVAKAEFSERFAREAKAVAALNHPNICTLYDVGPNYLVMENVEGAPLKGTPPVDRVLKYARKSPMPWMPRMRRPSSTVTSSPAIFS